MVKSKRMFLLSAMIYYCFTASCISKNIKSIELYKYKTAPMHKIKPTEISKIIRDLSVKSAGFYSEIVSIKMLMIVAPSSFCAGDLRVLDLSMMSCAVKNTCSVKVFTCREAGGTFTYLSKDAGKLKLATWNFEAKINDVCFLQSIEIDGLKDTTYLTFNDHLLISEEAPPISSCNHRSF